MRKIVFCIYDLFSHIEWPPIDYLILPTTEFQTRFSRKLSRE